MNYTQLTREQRYQIYGLMKAGHNQSQIAALVGCHKSTIMRELRRNCGIHGYYPNQAQLLTRRRQRHSHGPRIPAQTWQQVERLLGQQWSPEQITGRLNSSASRASVQNVSISKAMPTSAAAARSIAIYGAQKKQRKRYSGYLRRGQIPNRTSIDKRPQIVASKRRYGDWEADTIIGAGHRGGI